MKNILLIVDKPNWAYDSIAKSLLKFNNNKNFNLIIDYSKNPKVDLNSNSNTNISLFFFIGWQTLFKKNIFGNYVNRYPKIDKKKIICGIHSHHSWDDRKSTPENIIYPNLKLINALNEINSVNLVSKRLFDIFYKSGLKNGHLTYNGVDIEIFNYKKKQLNKTITVGYSGSKKHDWRKGITQFIEPAASIPNVILKIAAPQINYIAHDEMFKFYQDLNIYVCASSSEGFSLSVLEALSCGVPVISTRVGGCEEIIKDGYNGFLVSRDVNSIKNKISYLRDKPNELLRMSINAFKTINNNWSWEKRSVDWYNFIYQALKKIND